jgi:hypothetical protein
MGLRISGGSFVPQVASDPKIHAHGHNLARVARHAQQPDRASSPFESLLDAGAPATDQPAPPPPDDKATRTDSAQPVQPSAKTKDTSARRSPETDGRAWPDGAYTLTATAVDANNQSVAISTEVQATVDSVDLTQDPPQLSINRQNYTLDKIKRIVRSTS